MSRVLVSLVAWCLGIGSALGAPTPVVDDALHFSLTVPDGFTTVPEQVEGNTLHAFRRLPAADGGEPGAVVLVDRLGGTIGREPMSEAMLQAASPGASTLRGRWRGFDVDGMRVPIDSGDVPTLALALQIPLAPEAIQITVMGAADDEAQLNGLLSAVVGTVDGGTNWTAGPETQPGKNLSTEQRVTAGVKALLGVVVVGGVLFAAWQARKKKRA